MIRVAQSSDLTTATQTYHSCSDLPQLLRPHLRMMDTPHRLWQNSTPTYVLPARSQGRKRERGKACGIGEGEAARKLHKLHSKCMRQRAVAVGQGFVSTGCVFCGHLWG